MLRQYGEVLKVGSAEEFPLNNNWTLSSLSQPLPVTTTPSFYLSRAGRTDELKSLKTLKCFGSLTVQIRWVRDVKYCSSNKFGADSPADVFSHESILHELPDECLYDICDQRVLTLQDLCAIARTCERFENVADIIFRRCFRKDKIFLDSKYWTLPQCEVLFQSFGHHITSMQLDDINIFEDIMLGFIARYCPNIEYLNCCRIDAIAEALLAYKSTPFIQQAPFGRLIELEYVAKVKGGRIKSLPLIELPSLRRFSIAGAVLTNRTKVEMFFSINNKITTLILRATIFDFHVQSILKHLPALVDLRILVTTWQTDEVPAYDLQCIVDLRHLIIFHYCHWSVACIETVLETLAAANISLKYLGIISTDYTRAVEHLKMVTEVQMFAMDTDGAMQLTEFVRDQNHLQLIAGDGMIGFRRIAS